MPDLDDLDPERRALFGFRYGYTEYRGWFESLFEAYSLYPYLNLLRQETRDLLYKKTLFSKLVPIFAKNLRVTEILKKMIGIDWLSCKGDAPGLIEQLATAITEEVETRRTLNDRLAELDKRLTKEQKYFCGMTHKIYGRDDKSVLKQRTFAAEGTLVAVEGILNHIEAIAIVNPALARTFEGTGIKWILADFPYFELTSDNRYYDGNVLGLRIDDTIAAVLTSFPFDAQVGWYPYVTVFGVFHNSLSPKFSQLKVVDWCWMKLRVPKSYEELPSLLQEFLDESAKPTNVEGIAHQPWLDLGRQRDIPMFLGAIQIVNRANNLDYSLVRTDTKSLAEKAHAAATKPVIGKIASYFNSAPADTSS